MPSAAGPRCPQCFERLPLKSLGALGFWGNLGVECPYCGAKLVVVRTRWSVTRLILAALLGVGLIGWRIARRTGQVDMGKAALVCLAAALVGSLLLIPFMPNLLSLRLVGTGEPVTFPLGTPKAEEEAEAGWICPKCHVKNPENFELCWKCEHARPKRAGI
jgi:hypothetical protein